MIIAATLLLKKTVQAREEADQCEQHLAGPGELRTDRKECALTQKVYPQMNP